MPLQAHKDQNGKIILPPDYFVFVKGGTFLMGGEEFDREQPIHEVTVSDFYIRPLAKV